MTHTPSAVISTASIPDPIPQRALGHLLLGSVHAVLDRVDPASRTALERDIAERPPSVGLPEITAPSPFPREYQQVSA